MNTKALDDRLTSFFAEYATASASGDVEKVAAAYSSTYIESTPTTCVAWHVDDDYRSGLREQASSMRELGLSSAKADVEEISDLAPGHVSVLVGWTLTFDRPNAPVISRFDITYVVRLIDEPEIVLSASHEDEVAVMQRDGVIPADAPLDVDRE